MKKVLVIEDDDLIRETVLEVLEWHGFEAVGAHIGNKLEGSRFCQYPFM